MALATSFLNLQPKHRFTQDRFRAISVVSTVRRPEQPEISALPPRDKARRLGLSFPVDLEWFVIIRGCDYYDRELSSRIPQLGEGQCRMLNWR
jgi:hypothetical protein